MWEYSQEHICDDGKIIMIAVHSDVNCKKGPIVGFDINHGNIRELIKNRDNSLFDIFEKNILQAERMAEAFKMDLEIYDLERYRIRSHQAKNRCLEIINTGHAFDSTKETARKILIQIETKAHKKILTESRRRQFDEKRTTLMLALIDRDGYVCQETGSTENLTIDHILPISKGGTDDLSNLRLVTKSINSIKGDR